MKNIWISFLLLGIFISTYGQEISPCCINVMTFNVRYDNPHDKTNNWKYRKEVAAEVIHHYDIDILGTQEVLHNQYKDFSQYLHNYGAIGVGRADGKTKGEYSAIFYKKDRFDILESGHFWLSETPRVAGSKGWDAACERIATWAILEEKEHKQRIFVLNTHLDHVGKTARRKSIRLITEKTDLYGKDMPVIVTGDFNISPSSDVIYYITSSNECPLKDCHCIFPNSPLHKGTFHDFGKIPTGKRERIDYIFINDKLDVTKYEILPEKHRDIYLSDHNPVMVNLQLK